jgi:WD40 repeat protein
LCWAGLIGIGTGCGAVSPTQAPVTKPPAAVASTAASAPVNRPPAPSELSRTLAEAKELEERGAVDTAANRLVHAYNLSKDGAHLLRAAELYEEAWQNSTAKWVLEALGKRPEHAAEVAGRLARLPERPEIPEVQERQVDALLSLAHAHLVAGDRAAAEGALQAAGQIAWTRDALRLSATLAWKRGDKRTAQLAWARLRAFGGLELSTAELAPLPSLSWANASFLVGPIGVAGWSIGGLEKPPLLQFAAANGDMFGYSLEWGVTVRTSGNLFQESHLIEEPNPLTKRRLNTALPLAYYALLDAKGPSEAGALAARASSSDGARLALLSTHAELVFLAASADSSTDPQLMFQGPLSEHGRPLKLHLEEESPLADVGVGKSERLYLAPRLSRFSVLKPAGEVLELNTQGAVLRRWKAEDKPLTALAASRDGRFLATSQGRSVKVWDLRSLKEVFHTKVAREAAFLAFHPSDDVLEAGQEFQVDSFEWKSGRALPPKETGETIQLVHSGDGKYTASAVYKSESITIERAQGAEAHQVHGPIWSAAQLSDDGRALLVNGSSLWLFKLEPWRATRLSSDRCRAVALAPNGRRVAVYREQRIDLLADDGKLEMALPWGEKEPRALTFAHDDELVVGDGKLLRHYQLPGKDSQSSNQGRLFERLTDGALIVKDDGVLHDSQTLGHQRLFKGDKVYVNHPRTVFAIADKQQRVLTIYNGAERVLGEFKDLELPDDLALSEDGRHFLAWTHEPTKLWLADVNAGTWRQVQEGLHGGLSGVKSMVLLPGIALTAGADGVVAFDLAGQQADRAFLTLIGHDWFSLAHRDDATATDGVPEAIDHVVNGIYFWHPGSLWERLRHTGSFGAFMMGKKLPDYAETIAE